MDKHRPISSNAVSGQSGKTPSESLTKEVGRGVVKGLLQEAKATLKWGVGGAMFGAAVLGGLGFWKFGTLGLGVGALAGAVLGGVGGIWVYLSAT